MRRVLVLAVLLAACAKKPPPRDVEDAMNRCQEALARIGAMPDDGRDFFAVYAEGCADLPADEACRKAWREAARVPAADRTITLVTGCRGSCENLPEPRPALCTTDPAKLTPAARDAGWSALSSAILRHDLPMPKAAKLVSLLAQLEAPAEAPTLVSLQIRPKTEGGWLVQVEHDRAKEVSVPLTPSDVDEMAGRMAEIAPPASSAAVVRVEEGLPRAQLDPIVNALKSKGFRDVSLEIVPAPR